MSKYSVDELVKEIQKPTWDYVSGELDDVIIAKLRAADALQVEAIRVMGDLCLGDDPEFAELNKRIDEYEEAGS